MDAVTYSECAEISRFSVCAEHCAICLSQLVQKFLEYGSQQPGGGSLGDLSNFQVKQKGFSNRTVSTSLPILIMFFFCFAVPMIENLDATLRQGQVPMPQQITSPQPMPNFSNIELPSSVNLPSVTSKEASAVQLTSAGSIHSVNASETPHVVPPVSISSAPTTLSKFLTSLSTFHLNPHFCVLFG